MKHLDLSYMNPVKHLLLLWIQMKIVKLKEISKGFIVNYLDYRTVEFILKVYMK